MSDSSSRRNFLFGRSPAIEDTWLLFLARLRRACEGVVTPQDSRQGRLVPKRFDDVLQARSLCLAHGVRMALEGLPLPVGDLTRPVLWVQAGSAWGSLMPLGTTGLWRVEAGCPVAGMQAAGLLGEPVAGSVSNLAQWLAMGDRHARHLDHLGLVSVEWLFADGTIEVLGPFGQADSQPLRSLKAQRTIPKLFELAAEPMVREALESDCWPGGFRIDALARTPEVNLANLVVGNAGALGWLVAATFAQEKVRPLPGLVMVGTSKQVPPATQPWSNLNQQFKQVMDPEGLFLSPSI